MNQIRTGMTVHSADGQRLGKVIACREDSIVIEKGIFFPVDYTCRPDDVAEVRGDDLVLRLSKEQLEGNESRAGSEIGTEIAREERGSMGKGVGRAAAKSDVHVPVSEEQLDVQKRARKAGEVRVSKQVHTEEKQVTVPVTREEVHVDRVPAGSREATGNEARFAQENVSVPVMEEEVELRKRPVVREEVRIHKESHEEQRPVHASVRREEVDIDQDKDDDGSRRLSDDPDKRHL